MYDIDYVYSVHIIIHFQVYTVPCRNTIISIHNTIPIIQCSLLVFLHSKICIVMELYSLGVIFVFLE